jgi:hypothetical protein
MRGEKKASIIRKPILDQDGRTGKTVAAAVTFLSFRVR